MTNEQRNRLELELLEVSSEARQLRAAVRHMGVLQDRVNDLERKLDASRRVAMAFEEEIACCPYTEHHVRYVFGEGDDE